MTDMAEEKEEALSQGRRAGEAVNRELYGTEISYVLVMFVPNYGLQIGSNIHERAEVAKALSCAQELIDRTDPDYEEHHDRPKQDA